MEHIIVCVDKLMFSTTILTINQFKLGFYKKKRGWKRLTRLKFQKLPPKSYGYKCWIKLNWFKKLVNIFHAITCTWQRFICNLPNRTQNLFSLQMYIKLNNVLNNI